MSHKIIFIGGIGSETQFGGELTKNKEIIKRLKELRYDTVCIDTYGGNHSKMKLLKVVYQIITSIFYYSEAPIIFSSSFNNIYPILKLFYRLGIKRKIIYWVIGGIFGERVRNNEFDNSILKQIQIFLVEGQLMQTQLKEAGFENSIYVPNFKTIHKTHHHKMNIDSVCRFVFLSRITPQKGCDDIFISVDRLKKLGYGNRFIIDFYGTIDPEYYDRFQELLKAHPEVNYKGKLDLNIEENYQLLAEYDYMLFPTYWYGEGFPGVVIDAYKAGLPIIASDWNFNSEFVIDGETGIIVKAKDRIDLTEKIQNALSHKYDIHSMSEKANLKSWEYDTKRVISKQLINNFFEI